MPPNATTGGRNSSWSSHWVTTLSNGGPYLTNLFNIACTAQIFSIKLLTVSEIHITDWRRRRTVTVVRHVRFWWEIQARNTKGVVLDLGFQYSYIHWPPSTWYAEFRKLEKKYQSWPNLRFTPKNYSYMIIDGNKLNVKKYFQIFLICSILFLLLFQLGRGNLCPGKFPRESVPQRVLEL